jgi:hypothetical protein
MEEIKLQDTYRKLLLVLLIITIIIHVPAITLYAWARHTGELMSEAQWSSGAGAGPWKIEPKGFFIKASLLATLILPFITFLFAAVMSLWVKSNKIRIFTMGAALAVFQFVVGFAVTYITGWTVD